MSLLSKLLIILGLTTAMLGSSVTAEEPILSKETQDQLKAQCDANDANACGALGIFIVGNKEVPLQERGPYGIGLIEKACDLGGTPYCTFLGLTYSEKNGDPKLAAEYFKKACDSGDGLSSPSCYMLGKQYFNGQGVQHDLTLASAYWKKACDLGSGVSCFMLGKQYFFGQGVQQDLIIAPAYFKKGCDLKDTSRQSCLIYGVMNAEIGNYVIAKEYLAKGCSLGDMNSCYELEKLSD